VTFAAPINDDAIVIYCSLLHVKFFSIFIYFAKDVEEWFGYGNLKVFCHISASCSSFSIKYKITDERQLQKHQIATT